jgi:hypothetical protein
LIILQIPVSPDSEELALSIVPNLEVPIRAAPPVPLFVHQSTHEAPLQSAYDNRCQYNISQDEGKELEKLHALWYSWRNHLGLDRSASAWTIVASDQLMYAWQDMIERSVRSPMEGEMRYWGELRLYLEYFDLNQIGSLAPTP